MTCIVWQKNKLYADSLVYKDGELLHSLTKIQGILHPFRIQCERAGFVFDDIVHGWSGTGAYMPMLKFVETLQGDALTEGMKDGPSSGTILFYEIATEKDLVVAMGNLFEVLLIGEQANHSFRFDTDGFAYKRYEKTDVVCMGSGAQMCLNHIQSTPDEGSIDVLRAMLQVFAHDQASGGFIDCWEMTKDKEGAPLFQRFGLHHEIPKDLIHKVLDTVYPNKRRVRPTFVRQDRMMRSLLVLDNENQEMSKKLALAEARNRRYRKKLGIAEPKVKAVSAKKSLTSNQQGSK